MAKIELAVCDSGPLIHLSQVNSFSLLDIIKKIYISNEVYSETTLFNLPGSKEIKSSKTVLVKSLCDVGKDMAKMVAEKYSLGMGEATSIALAKQEEIKLLLTDDLSARTVAESYGLEVHGSIGIVLRAFREKIIDSQKAVQTVLALKEKSNLFITSDLVDYIIKEIEKYKE
jgi:predicted nucleic acid-binding protein